MILRLCYLYRNELTQSVLESILLRGKITLSMELLNDLVQVSKLILLTYHYKKGVSKPLIKVVFMLKYEPNSNMNVFWFYEVFNILRFLDLIKIL